MDKDETLPDLPSFSARLRYARELRGLTIEQAAERTKLDPDFVRACENGDFDHLSPEELAVLEPPSQETRR